MTQEKILEGNKLIAEFMDLKQNDFGHWINKDYLFGSQLKLFDFELKYHSSWDWLIPVIDKIEDLDVSDQHYQWKDSDGKIQYNFMCFEFDMIRHSDSYSASIWMELSLDPARLVAGGHLKPYSTRIEAVWNCVVEFIKWYNLCQKIS